jgi:hypothetical protein
MLNRHDAEFFGRQPRTSSPSAADLLASEDADIVEAHDRSVLTAGTPVARELHFASRPWIEWSYEVKFPIRDARRDGGGVGRLAVDISTLKRTEQPCATARRACVPSWIMRDADLPQGYRGEIPARQSGVRAHRGCLARINCAARPSSTCCARARRAVRRSIHEVMALGQLIARESSDPAGVLYRESLAVKFPVRDSRGNVVGSAASPGHHLSAAGRECLRESEARLRRAQLQRKLACWCWDLDTDCYAWAPGSGLRWALWSRSAGRRCRLQRLRPIRGPRTLWRLYAEVEAGRDTFIAEFRILRPTARSSGSRRSARVERDAAGGASP